MICKWCGAKIDISKGKCSVCGRDIPALSDCGGFYDVVPKAMRPAVPRCVQEPYTQPENDVKPTSPPPLVPKKREKRSAVPMVTLALLLLIGIFAIVRSVSLGKRIDNLERQVASNGSTIDQLQRSNDSALEQITEVKEQLNTESTVQEYTDPMLSELDASFCVKILENGSHIFSNLQNCGIFEYLTSDTDQRAAACYLNGKQLWEAKLSEEPSGRSFSRDKSFCFSYDVDAEQLGQYQSGKPTEFVWLYRSTDSAAWIELKDGDGIQIETVPAKSKSTITIADAWFREDLPDGDYEIKCIMKRYSKDGGTLEIDFELIEVQE